MKLWLASSNLETIADLIGAGLFAGLITNPDVVAAAAVPPDEFFSQAAQRTSTPIFCQVREAGFDEMLAEARRLVAIAPDRMIVKVAATQTGFRLMARLVRDGVKVAATCIPTSPLAVVSESLGADYIIPWGSFLPKRGVGDREDLIVEIVEMLDRQRSRSEIVVGAYGASDLARLARIGVRNVFVWEKDVDAFFRQPLAEEAAATFEGAWRAIETGGY